MLEDRDALTNAVKYLALIVKKHDQWFRQHTTEHIDLDELLKRIEQNEQALPWTLEILPSREEKEEYLVTLEDLRKALEETKECFDDLRLRLNRFNKVQTKARELFESVQTLDLRKDVRKQVALYIRDAIVNTYAENLQPENLQALFAVIDIAGQSELEGSDRRKILKTLYDGGFHAFPHLTENVSEVYNEPGS